MGIIAQTGQELLMRMSRRLAGPPGDHAEEYSELVLQRLGLRLFHVYPYEQITRRQSL